MTATHAAKMIGDGDQIVDSISVIFIDNVWRHVEVFYWKLNHRVQFVSPNSSVAKSFETDYK